MTRRLEYKPEYCDLLIDRMEHGYSFEAFAGVVGVSKRCLYNWLKEYPEFEEAYEIAREKCRVFWERTMILGTTGKIKNFNATMVIFQMKNRFREEWRDVHNHEHSGNVGGKVVITLPDNGRTVIAPPAETEAATDSDKKE